MAPFNNTLVKHNAKASDDDVELQVIGAEPGHHPSLSILGFAPCHHMASLFETPARSVAFLDALNGKATDFRALMAGFRATVDNPGCDLVPELMAAFPKAKVVLGLRDSPEVWWKSCSETVYCMSYTSYQALVYPIPFLGLQSRVVTAILENKWLARYGVLSGPEVYTRHRAFIRDIVPPDQLLEFNVKEGWEPLCKFLGVPVPDVPFPHTNDSAEVNANIRMAKLMGVAAWTGILAVLGGAFYWGVREEVWKTTFGFLRKLI